MYGITAGKYRSSVTHTTAHRARVLGMMMTITMLSACTFAPGQRMIQPPTLPVSNTDDGKASGETVQIPITDITIASVKRLRQTVTPSGASGATALFGDPGPYRVGPGDVLQITVWDHPELAAALGQQPNTPNRPADAASGFIVDHEGNLQFPYIGTIHVAGDSAETVQRRVTADLSKVMVKPQVTVRVASFRAAQIYIDGEVRTPGAQSINDIPMTLTEAINRAGGYSPNADQSHVTIVRDDKTYEINVAQMLKNGENPSRIVLKNGDLLRIEGREEYGVYVMGEVGKPATVTPMKDGTLTLGEAISQAGSVNPATSDPKELYVIRGEPNGQPQIYHLDARSPVAMLLANQFDLQPKDVVYVDASGLVRFSRVLDLLLPLVNAGVTGAVVAK
ncbi:polysaccharide biosynthesis/export family protein [Paraburkholderia sp. BCC1885]|uniref:polysaccharide biosynthesis/export family protein n=1 Tax=Paraburkholderia sp. BCC1885 TaxID=2562669 RepID=UPI00391F6A0F